MKINKANPAVLIVVALASSIGCGEDPAEPPRQGSVTVLVIDNSSQEPVADVEITLAGAGLTQHTDTEGRAVFKVVPGDYFVDAKVCCVGPGWIEYHVPVTVIVARAAKVTLHACLACV